jgi:hypothetical protein
MFICLDLRMNQEQIDDLNNLVDLYKSNYRKSSDVLIVVFHWWLVKHGFYIGNIPVRKNTFK